MKQMKSAWNTQRAQTNMTPNFSFYDTELLMRTVYPESVLSLQIAV